jgi:cyanophycinase
MQELESQLIAGRPPRYVQLPTAAAPEGEESLNRWIALGESQARRMGVESIPVVVRDRDEAQSQELAELISGAGLIYLSGGNPGFLADTLRDSLVWDAIVSAWQDGAALAGCSAGAMAIADHIPALRRTREVRGLGVLPHIRVLPHFDKMLGWVPDLALRMLQVPGGVHVVGIDEDTALVGGPYEWQVQGRQSAWLLTAGKREEFPAGSVMTTPA